MFPLNQRSCDVAFFNSVIEHVGDWERQHKFAGEMRRIGNAVFCQAPCRWAH
jgi:hypothetical protein